MEEIVLHDRLAVAPWMDPALWRLPGVKPLDPDDWLIRDETFQAQMRLREHLIATRRDKVHALTQAGRDAAGECLDLVLETLAGDTGYRLGNDRATRPDGAVVAIDRDQPLLTIGRLIQSDVCLMQEGAEGHVLTGAILCFPASWTLAEKIGRPLMAIHGPVPEYDSAVGMRVQRLFDAIRPDRPLWRANAVLHNDPSLFHPRSEHDPPSMRRGPPGGKYLRSERQTLRRLARTGAVVFTIHTTVIEVDRLSDAQKAGLAGITLKSG